MAAAAGAAGVRAEVSFSAGSFVCNQVFFGLQHRLRRRKVRGGFLHVPALGGAMDLEQMLLGVQAGLRVASEAESDLRLRGGLLD
jgi:pyroglutamyl-peptidase